MSETREVVVLPTKVVTREEGYVLPEMAKRKLDQIAALSPVDYAKETDRLSNLRSDDLRAEIGDYQQLPYEVLRNLLPGGTEDGEVAQVLRDKREVWLVDHPDQSVVKLNAAKGVITFSGQFVSQDVWMKMTMGERRGVLVGTTCSHYEHDVSGLSDDDTRVPGLE